MIAPHAKLDDGLFDVVILGNFSAWTIVRHIPKIYRGTHQKIPGVSLYRGKTIRITSEETVLLDLDGEQPGRGSIHFKLDPSRLCLWCPQI